MRIVVVGAGKLGYSIASLLSKEQFDVIVIDHDEGQLEAVKNTLDVLTIFANGASPITMNDPDIRGADILIAVTASDEVNMVACILAKKHGIRHTIARIREASVEELQQAPGMNRPAAEAVYHFFQAQRDMTRYHADGANGKE